MHIAHAAADARWASALGDSAVRSRQTRHCVRVQHASVASASAPRLQAAGGHRRVSAAVAAAGAAAVSGPSDDVLSSYRKLQNGSDVRGVALPGIQGQDVTLTTQRCVTKFLLRGIARNQLLRDALAAYVTPCAPKQRLPLGGCLCALAGQADKQAREPAARLGAWLPEYAVPHPTHSCLCSPPGTHPAPWRGQVGTDPRLSGPDIMDAVLSGLQRCGHGAAQCRSLLQPPFSESAHPPPAHSGGAQPVRMGLCTTPACFMSCITPGERHRVSAVLLGARADCHFSWHRQATRMTPPSCSPPATCPGTATA